MGKRLALLVLITIVVCLFVGVFAEHPARAETETVTAGIPRDFYPEYAIGPDDRPAGFGVDVMNAVAKRAWLSVTYRIFPTWSETLAALERGDIDLIPVVVITPAREGRLLFTRPVLTSRISMFIRQYTGEVQGMADLVGRRVGVIKGGPVTELIGKGERSPVLVHYGRLQDEIFGLLLGEVDALIALEDSVWKLADRAQVADRLKVVGDPVMETKRAMAVRRDLPGLRDRLDAAVADLLNSSEFSSIYAAWHAEPPSFWTTERMAWAAGASMALLLLGMLFWQSLSLRTESRQLAESSPGKLPGERVAVEIPARFTSRICGLVAVALGLAVLLGWAFDVAILRSLLPGLVAMQPWTAITITLAGVALLLATIPGWIVAAISIALAGAVLIIGLQMLLQSATGFDLGIDRWFFTEALGNQPRYPHPGRSAEATSIAFALLGTMILLSRVERAWAQKVFSIIGTGGLLLMGAALVGYLIGVGALQSVAFVTPVALHTALGLAILFLGALVLRPDAGWMAILSSDGPGAASARMLLPVTVVGPLLLVWLFALGKQTRIYGPEFQAGLDTLATIALLATSLLWSAARVDRLHRARLAAAEALRESEEQLRVAIEAADLGVWDLDLKTDTAPKRSLRHDQMFGYAELQPEWGQTICERHVLDEDKPRFREGFARALETGVLTFEVRVRWPDDSVHWISPLGQAYYDEHGEPVRIAGVVGDITARKRAEEQLTQQFGLLTAITDSAADAIFVSDGEGRVNFMNPAAERIFGWSREELTGRKLHDAIHDRHSDGRPYPASECPLSRVYATGETLLGHEDVFFHKDGSQVLVACSNAPLMIEGRIAGSVLVAHDITERKRSEVALRESEARYRTAGEAIRYGVWVCNPEGGVEFVSQTFLDLIGKTLDEVKPRGWLDRLPPEDLKPTLDAWRECVRTGSEWTWEHRVKGKDGAWRTILSLGRPVRDQWDRITSWVGFNLDISARKEAEDALRESEIRMRALLDASQDEILLMSTQGEVLAINKAAQRRLARRTGGADPVGAHLDRLLPRDQVEQRMAIVRQVAATATLVHYDVPIRTRWFEFWFYPVLQPDKPVSEVAVYAREITEQKKSQADLSKLFQAIQQSPMSVVITDQEGNIEYVNPEFTKVTGYTLAEAVGKNPHILKSGHTPPELYAELWETISAGGVWRGEFHNKRKNGELFWELASIAPVKDGDKITNFVAVKEDITERKQMEEQLRQSQKIQAVGQLTGGIAHDFNNLLAIVMGNLQLLGERVSGDAKAREYLDDALWSAKRGGELTHRLLAFARKQPLKPAVIDLNDVVRGMTDLLRRTLGANIRIEELLAPNLWKAFADRGELENALVNLAVNARDAMRSAGTLTLETRNAVLDEDYAEQYEEVTPGEYVLLAVADTGTGMSPEIMQQVFEPFFTTKEVGQGSGLGLSMVYGFVKQSGGHVSLYSRVGHGTSVKLYLPRAPSSPVGRQEEFPDVLPEDLGNKVVLVVEDEAKLRKVAVKMLDRLGLQSMQAKTAKEALELLADTHVDVLFTDIELPGGMNGTELAETAQKLDPNIKVLFTTGYARETTLHERGLHERATWLLKPYSHRELARELKALLTPKVH